MSDGRAGIEAQVVGLSDAIARLVPCEITVKRVGWKGRTGPPALVAEPAAPALDDAGQRHTREPARARTGPTCGSPPAAPPCRCRSAPGAGRAARPIVVQIQDPRVPPQMFDLVIPPRHDRLSRRQRLPDHRLAAPGDAGSGWRPNTRPSRPSSIPCPSPRVAVLVGGKSKAFDLSSERAAQIAHAIQIPLEQDGGSAADDLLAAHARAGPAP